MDRSVISDAQNQQINFDFLVNDGKLLITVKAKGQTYVKQIDHLPGITFERIQEYLHQNRNFTIISIKIKVLKLTVEDLGLSIFFDNIIMVQHQQQVSRLKQILRQQNETYHQTDQRLKAQINRLKQEIKVYYQSDQRLKAQIQTRKQSQQQLKIQNESHTSMIVQLKQALEEKEKQLTKKFKFAEYSLHQEKLELEAKILELEAKKLELGVKITDFMKQNSRLQEILKSKMYELEQVIFQFNDLAFLSSQKDQKINQLKQNTKKLQADVKFKDQSLDQMYHQFSKLRDNFNQKLNSDARQKSLMKKQIADKNLMIFNFNLKSRESENRSITPSKLHYQLALANNQIRELNQAIQIKEGKINAVTEINNQLQKQLNQKNAIVMKLRVQLQNQKKNQQNIEFGFQKKIIHREKINQVRSRSTSPTFETIKVINTSNKLEHKFGKLNPEVKNRDFKNLSTQTTDSKNKLKQKQRSRFDQFSQFQNKQKVSVRGVIAKNPSKGDDITLSKGEKNELKKYLETHIKDPNHKKINQRR